MGRKITLKREGENDEKTLCVAGGCHAKIWEAGKTTPSERREYTMRNLGLFFTGVLLAVGGSLGSPPTMAYAPSRPKISRPS